MELPVDGEWLLLGAAVSLFLILGGLTLARHTHSVHHETDRQKLNTILAGAVLTGTAVLLFVMLAALIAQFG